MCISKEDREKLKFKITNPPHILQTFKERGKDLFQSNSLVEMLEETQRHIKDDMRCVICPDLRESSKSNYLAMFLTDAGDFAVIPVYIDETHINILTIKDLSTDYHINWHIDQYNKIGKERGVPPLRLIFKRDRL